MHMPAFPILKYFFFLKTHAIEKKNQKNIQYIVYSDERYYREYEEMLDKHELFSLKFVIYKIYRFCKKLCMTCFKFDCVTTFNISFLIINTLQYFR